MTSSKNKTAKTRHVRIEIREATEDDLDDIECLKAVGYSVCPDNAADAVKAICDYVSPYHGGRGVVREVIRSILTRMALWP